MDGHEEPIIALSNRGTKVHRFWALLPTTTTPFLHIDDHLLEGVGFFLDLATADWWQQES